MNEHRREVTHHHDGHGLTEACLVIAADAPHPVNKANHVYVFERALSQAEQAAEPSSRECIYVGSVRFQRGPRAVEGSTPGTLDGALLAVLIDRYEAFQSGPFACIENDVVLDHLRCALDAIKARAHDRAARGVLGKNQS